jgi:hypothetical protein
MTRTIVGLAILVLAFIYVGESGEDKDLTERQYFFYVSESRQFIEPVELSLIAAREILIGILADSLSYKPKVYIENNLKEFNGLVGSAFPDWGAAAALPYRQMIAVKSPAHFRLGKSLRELIQHEYAHLSLAHRLHHVHPPRWLDEGVAMYTSAEWGWQDNLAMSRAVIFRSLVPLRDIEKLNRFSQGKAHTAYSQSYLAVKYFLNEYGAESFNIFLDSLRVGRSLDEAFMAGIGSDYDGFEKEFFAYLEQRYNLMTLFGDLYFLWIFLAAVVVAGFFIMIRKRRRYFRKWEEEEKYQSTDFDYGDPDNPEQVEDDDKPWA